MAQRYDTYGRKISEAEYQKRVKEKKARDTAKTPAERQRLYKEQVARRAEYRKKAGPEAQKKDMKVAGQMRSEKERKTRNVLRDTKKAAGSVAAAGRGEKAAGARYSAMSKVSKPGRGIDIGKMSAAERAAIVAGARAGAKPKPEAPKPRISGTVRAAMNRAEAETAARRAAAQAARSKASEKKKELTAAEKARAAALVAKYKAGQGRTGLWKG